MFNQDRAYEWVFAVFDRDNNLTYHDALIRVRNLDQSTNNDEGKRVRFIAIPSVPCFELWLLLHYRDVHAFGHRDEIIRALKTHVLDYAKGNEGMYAKTEHALPDAIRRAESLQRRFTPESGTDPYTNVNEVVTLLRSIRRDG